MKAILVRHGQTDVNLEATVFSTRDPELNLAGRAQVHILADWLNRWPLAKVVSSPLKRAEETARIIALDQGVEVTLESDLRELDCGEAEGLTREELKEKFPGLVEEWLVRPASARWPRGETLKEASDRVIGVLTRYARKYPEDAVCFVGHGIAFKGAVAELLGIGSDHFRVLSLDEASVSILEFYGDTVKLELLNFAPWKR